MYDWTKQINMILKLQLKLVASVYVLLNVVQYACGAESVRFGEMIILRANMVSQHLVTVQKHTDLGHCIKQCRASSACRAINYKVRAHICRLYTYEGSVSDIIQTTKSAPGFVYWKKDDSVQTSQPNSGTHEQTEIAFCPVPEQIGDIRKYGNMYTNGSKQAYRCFDHDENREYKQVIECSHIMWTGLYHVCGYGDVKSFGMKRIIFKFVNMRVSQSDAYQRCKKESGNLLILDTENKQSFLRRALPNGIDGQWTDSNRMGDYDWRTKDGNPIDNDVFHHGSTEYMFNLVNKHKCSGIDDSWKLRPYDCEERRPYVCEITL